MTGKKKACCLKMIFFTCLGSALYIYVGRNWLIVNFDIMLTYWWLLDTEMHMRQSQNTSPVKLERMSAKLPTVRTTNQIHSIELTGYSGRKKRAPLFVSSE